MISILLSCYNSNPEYLNEQVLSIINQTEKDWELLVYNDGTEWLEKYINSLNSKKIKYYDNGHKGYVGAYNFLLKKAKGKYICFCDHDDIWEKDKLEIEKNYLDENKNVDCVFGWLNWFGEKNKLESFSISDEDISKQLYFWQPIKNPTVMFRHNRFGELDAPFETSADFWFYAKHKDRHYHLIEKVLVHYRRHADEITKDKNAFRETSAKVIQENLKQRFEIVPDLDICRKLDRYSKTYDESLKKFIEELI